MFYVLSINRFWSKVKTHMKHLFEIAGDVVGCGMFLAFCYMAWVLCGFLCD